MKTAIIGSRGLCPDISRLIPIETTKIITGGFSVIDHAAGEYADERSILKIIIKADYAKYGRVAPLKRNKLMIKLSDMVIVVWNRRSYITKHAIDYALKIDKPMIIYMRPHGG